jgi:hypothetical protein
MLIAAATLATAGDIYFFARLRQVAKYMSAIAIANNCPGWYDDQHIPGISTMPVVDAAGPAFFGFPMLPVHDAGQAIGPFHGADDDTATVAAVPSVGTAARHVLLPVEADHAAATVAAFDVYYHSINEHRGRL